MRVLATPPVHAGGIPGVDGGAFRKIGIPGSLGRAEVRRLLAENGYRIGNVDATIVAQKPKMKDFIPKMNENIATVLDVSLDDVNVKATTEEKLGFTGSGAGIAAQAFCLLTP